MVIGVFVSRSAGTGLVASHGLQGKPREYRYWWRIHVRGQHRGGLSAGRQRESGESRPGCASPRAAVELELTRIWEEVLEVKNPDIRQDFVALSGHSLLAIRLIVLIEGRMGRDLPLATLFQAPTIEKLAEILRQEDAGPETTIVPLQPLGTRPPFFCVPGAGGTVLYLNELANHLGQDQLFYALQAKGLDGRCEPYPSVPRIADHYIQAVRTPYPSCRQAPRRLRWSRRALGRPESARPLPPW
jgi:acyl carrier protein